MKRLAGFVSESHSSQVPARGSPVVSLHHAPGVARGATVHLSANNSLEFERETMAALADLKIHCALVR
jgi:hypothetical protein